MKCNKRAIFDCYNAINKLFSNLMIMYTFTSLALFEINQLHLISAGCNRRLPELVQVIINQLEYAPFLQLTGSILCV